jgi:PAS domain S-box-containing protein
VSLPSDRGAAAADRAARPPRIEPDDLPLPYLAFARGRLCYANREARTRLGLPDAELSLAELVSAGDREALERGARLGDGGWIDLGVIEWHRPHGRGLPATTSVRRIGGPDAAELHAIVQPQEADALEQELGLLREDVARLQVLGGLGRYEIPRTPREPGWFSSGFYAIVGRDPALRALSREAYLGEVVHPDDREDARAAIERALASRSRYEASHRIVRDDGAVRHVESSGEPIVDEQGLVTGLRGTLHDVTARVRSESELQQQGAWLSAILDTAVEAIILIDSRGVIRSLNPAAERLFGWSADEIRGRNVSMLMPAPFSAEHDGYLANYLATGVARIIGIGREVVGLRKDRSEFPMELAVSEVRLGDQRMFSGFVRDISERKRLEAEFLRSQKTEIVGRLSQGIAHDFNNLLMGIRSCASLAEDELAGSGPAAALVKEIENATERGIALTRRLLAFSRNRPSKLVPVRVGEVIEANAPMWRRLLGEDVELSLSCDAGGGRILGDAGLLEQVLINLVVNARDAMPRGGRISIETSLREAPPASGRRGTELVLVVRDQGSGIDPRVLPRIFEPFFTTKDPGKGTGLGLSTVAWIVKELGATIDVASDRGRGSTFRIAFPCCEDTSADDHESSLRRAPSEAGPETILLVEDEALIRLALRQFLSKQGYRVLAAADAEQAQQMVAEHAGRVDLLLSDVVLPGIDGGALAERLREARPTLACILMSAHARETLLEQGRLEEGAAYLEKPFDLPVLSALVRQVLDAAQTRGA